MSPQRCTCYGPDATCGTHLKLQHTPTPEVTIDGMILGGYPEEEAAFIVRAVSEFDADKAEIRRLRSTHSEMLEVLDNAFEDLNFDGTFEAKDILKTVEFVREKIRQTIAKAEGK